MKKLHFEYYMQIDYSMVVTRCNFTIKCIPKDTARQKMGTMDIEIAPAIRYDEGVDGLKNKKIYGIDEEPHTRFTFRIQGEAVAGTADYEEMGDEDLDMIFKIPHGMNVPGEKILRFFEEHGNQEKLRAISQKADDEKAYLEYVEEMMHELHRYMVYTPGSTHVRTTAEEALTQGCGVCQDYAHIFIALMHLAKLPARYVTGLIVGEGASHAWVEVLINGRWYGFDPTNDVCVKDEHIKIGVGRDAHDCMINRGIMHGGGTHTQLVQVSVTAV